MLAYIQKHHGEFANINTLTASLGFREKGYEIRTFELEDLAGLPLTPETPVAGGIPVVVQALSQLGFHAPEMPSIPSSLAPYSDRRTWTTVMEEARALVNAGQPVFVKPVAADRKLFAGTVFREFKDTSPQPMFSLTSRSFAQKWLSLYPNTELLFSMARYLG